MPILSIFWLRQHREIIIGFDYPDWTRRPLMTVLIKIKNLTGILTNPFIIFDQIKKLQFDLLFYILLERERLGTNEFTFDRFNLMLRMTELSKIFCKIRMKELKVSN